MASHAGGNTTLSDLAAWLLAPLTLQSKTSLCFQALSFIWLISDIFVMIGSCPPSPFRSSAYDVYRWTYPA